MATTITAKTKAWIPTYRADTDLLAEDPKTVMALCVFNDIPLTEEDHGFVYVGEATITLTMEAATHEPVVDHHPALRNHHRG